MVKSGGQHVYESNQLQTENTQTQNLCLYSTFSDFPQAFVLQTAQHCKNLHGISIVFGVISNQEMI